MCESELNEKFRGENVPAFDGTPAFSTELLPLPNFNYTASVNYFWKKDIRTKG